MKNYGFYSAAYSNNYIYWMTRDKGIFVRKSLNSDAIELLRIDKQIKTDFSTVYGVYKERLYGVLNSGKYLFEYDLVTKKFEIHEIGKESYALDLITYAEIVNDKIVVIGRYASKLVTIDIRNWNIDEHEILNSESLKTEHRFYSRGYIKKGNYIYIFNNENRQAIRISMENYDIDRFIMEEKIGYVEDGVADDDGFLLLNEKGEIYRMDEKFGTATKIFVSNSTEKKQELSGLIRNENELLLLPMFGKKFIIIDIHKGTIIKEIIFPKNTEFKSIDVVGWTPYVLKIENDFFCIGMYGTNQLFFVKQNDFKNYFFQEVKMDNADEIEYLINRGDIFIHEIEYDLSDFLNIVKLIDASTTKRRVNECSLNQHTMCLKV